MCKIENILAFSLYTNSSGAHSRASSLAEDTENGCYVDTDQPENYVDMEQSRRPADGMSSAASSCSITSGTPSTDLRFAEYQLEKVVSRFTPDEEDTRYKTENFNLRFHVKQNCIPQPTLRTTTSSILRWQ